MIPEEFEQFNIGLKNIREILAETAVLGQQTREDLDRLEANLNRTEAALRRAVRLAVREARAERERRRAGDEELNRMIERQDAAWQRFLDSRSHHNEDSNE